MFEILTLQDWMLYNNSLLKYDKDLVFNFSFNKREATGIGKVNIIRFADEIQLLDNEMVVWTEITNCKLILRDISQLSEEEIKKCYDISFWNYDGVEKDKQRIMINNTRKFERFDCSLSKAEKDLTDYLRSKDIDIDGFIKSGKAVKG